jgi:hypothetical protein
MSERTKSETEIRVHALKAAVSMIEYMRRSNAAFEKRTGKPSRVSEWEYVKAQDEVEAVLLRLAGLAQVKAKAAR